MEWDGRREREREGGLCTGTRRNCQPPWVDKVIGFFSSRRTLLPSGGEKSKTPRGDQVVPKQVDLSPLCAQPRSSGIKSLGFKRRMRGILLPPSFFLFIYLSFPRLASYSRPNYGNSFSHLGFGLLRKGLGSGQAHGETSKV